MDSILGREVENLKGQIGIIIDLDEKYITVDFDDGVKKYQYPGAFQKFLRVCDSDMEDWIKADSQRISISNEKRRIAERIKAAEEKKSLEAKRYQEQRKTAFLKADVLDKDLLLRLGLYDEFHDVYEELRDLCSDIGIPASYEVFEGVYQISKIRKNDEPDIIKKFAPKVIDLVKEQWGYFQDIPIPDDDILKKRYRENWNTVIGSEPIYRKGQHITRIFCISFNVFLLRIMDVMFDSRWIPLETEQKLKVQLEEIYNDTQEVSLLPGTVILDGILQELMVYKTLYNISCNINKHKVIAAVGTLQTEDREVSIPIHYCSDCRKAFIGKESLKFYQKLCGDFQTDISEEPDYYGDLGKSELYRYGYNVRADGMSRKQRRNLLIRLYETKKMTDFQIRRDIEKNIFMFKNNKFFKFAVRKWNDDLEFFNQYLLKKNGDRS